MARRVSWWKLGSIVVLAVIVVSGGACGACRGDAPVEPDRRLAAHLDRLCEVAEAGIDDPRAGVRRLMRYHGDHGPDMLEAFGATLVTIERIDDDEAHDRRARQARDRLQAPLLACGETWAEFAEAVEGDPEAAAILERGLDRLARTLEILLGAEGAAARGLRGLPAAVSARLDAATAPRRRR